MIGRKRNYLLISGKSKHKVLLFGNKIFFNWPNEIPIHQNAEITTLSFPEDYSKLERLTEFSLVILDYSSFFADNKLYKREQEVFEKQMIEALEAGTNICFVYYDEEVPRYAQYSGSTGYMNKSDIDKLRQSQIGFRWLDHRSIKPHNIETTIISGKHSRNEFKEFLNKWGATHNYFKTYGKGEIDDCFYLVQDACLAFSLNFRKGKLIYIPFQRDFSRKKDVLKGINCLIDACLTYITNCLVEFPEWAYQPLFENEKQIITEIDDLNKRLDNAYSKLEPYQKVKSLLLESQYTLEKSIPEFIEQRLNIQTERDERYLEDFWLTDNQGEKIAICEIKSVEKGFKKSSIFSLFNHREENKLSEEFPGILFVNCNLQAASWEDKDKSIDKQDYTVASKNNILILRIIDLVRLWYAKENGMITLDEIENYLLDCGWLFVNYDLKINILK